MKSLRLTAILVLAVTVASCCSCRSKKSANAIPFTNTTWQLVQIDGQPVKADGEKYSLTFSDDNRVAGMGDCNRVMGGYSIPSKGVLELSGMAGTRMFCPDQQAEDKFMQQLGAVDGYTIDGNMLMLFTKGDVKLIFEAK